VVGYYALKEVSLILKSNFDDFTVSRIGGEDFAVVLNNLDLEKPQPKLNTFLEQLANHVIFN
ncbi:diguanylate cyclase response regulator, partial [Pseudoalteromonas sp. S1649]